MKPRSLLNHVVVAAVAGALLFCAGAVVGAAPATAADAGWIVPSSVTVKRADGNTTQQWKVRDLVTLTADWVAPEGAQSGDTFSLRLTSDFSPYSFAPFDLESSSGEVFGTCEMSGAFIPRLTCTLSRAVENYDELHGTVGAKLQVVSATGDATFGVTLDDGSVSQIAFPGQNGGIGDVVRSEPTLSDLRLVGAPQSADLHWQVTLPNSLSASGLPLSVTGVVDPHNDSPATQIWFDPLLKQSCAGDVTTLSGMPYRLYTVEKTEDRQGYTMVISPEAWEPRWGGAAPCSLFIVYDVDYLDGSFAGDRFTNSVTVGETTVDYTVTIKASGSGSGSGSNRPVQFAVSKVVTGDGASLVPSGATFTINYTAAGRAQPPLTVMANGDPVLSPRFPANTEFVVQEAEPVPVAGAVWASVDEVVNGVSQGPVATLIPDSGTVAKIVVTNTADLPSGSFQLRKSVEGDGAPSVVEGTPFSVDYSYRFQGVDKSGTLTVTKGGAPVAVTLPAGAVVTLSEQAPTALAGSAWGTPRFVSNGTDLGSPATFTVAEGSVMDVTLTNTATVLPPVRSASVSVGDYVWEDSNRDGIQGSGETGMGGVRLALAGPTGGSVTDVEGHIVDAVVTAADGSYLFTKLPVLAGGQSYVVTVDESSPPLSGLVASPAGVGGDRSVDSGAGSATSGELTSDGASDRTVDFGFAHPAVGTLEISKLVTGPGAAAIADGTSFTVNYSYEHAGSTTTGSVSVSKGGPAAVVSGLPAGAVVTLTEQAPAPVEGVIWHAPSFADGAGTLLGAPATVTIADGTPLTVMLTNAVSLSPPPVIPAVSVGDLVWNDLNRDGIQDAGETGIEGVVLALTGPTGDLVVDVSGALVGPTTTGKSGTFLFSKLPVLGAGETYTVTIEQASPEFQFPSPAGVGDDPAADSSTGSAISRSLTVDGDSDVSLDFGFYAQREFVVEQAPAPIPEPGSGLETGTERDPAPEPAVVPSVSVGNFVWNDENRDGIQNAGEPGIVDVRVSILGPDENPVTDVTGKPVTPTSTNEDGEYLFSGLPVLEPGQAYTVMVEQDAPALAGFQPAPGSEGADPTIDSSAGAAQSVELTVDGATDLTLDFGFVATSTPSVTPGTIPLVATPDGSGAHGLASTGIDVRTVLIIVAVFVIVGTTLVLAGVRRRRSGQRW